MNKITRAEQENKLRYLLDRLHGDNALEYCVGLLSSLVNDKQLSTLITSQTNAYIAYWVDANENNTDQMCMGEMLNLTHETQVGIFNFCLCEDNEGNENPYADCPVAPIREELTEATK